MDMKQTQKNSKKNISIRSIKLWVLIGSAVILLGATIFLLIYFRQWVFTENTAAIICIIISVLALVGVGLLTVWLKKKN